MPVVFLRFRVVLTLFLRDFLSTFGTSPRWTGNLHNHSDLENPTRIYKSIFWTPEGHFFSGMSQNPKLPNFRCAVSKLSRIVHAKAWTGGSIYIGLSYQLGQGTATFSRPSNTSCSSSSSAWLVCQGWVPQIGLQDVFHPTNQPQVAKLQNHFVKASDQTPSRKAFKTSSSIFRFDKALSRSLSRPQLRLVLEPAGFWPKLQTSSQFN